MAENIYKAEWKFFRSKLEKFFLAAAAVFSLCAVASYILALQNPADTVAAFYQLRESFAMKGFFPEMGQWEIFRAILANNVLASFFVMALGIVPFLFLPLAGAAINGMMLGIVAAAVAIMMPETMRQTALSLVPHGIFELPAFFYAVGIGMNMSRFMSRKIAGKNNGIDFFSLLRQTARSFVFVVCPLLLAAAAMEAFVSYAIIK